MYHLKCTFITSGRHFLSFQKRNLRNLRAPKSAELVDSEIVCTMNEAGKGAVLGPCVVNILTMTRSNMQKLEAMKIPHRKQLKTPKERNEAYDIVMKHCVEYKSIKMEATEVDEWMFEKRDSLSRVIREKMHELLRHLEKQ